MIIKKDWFLIPALWDKAEEYTEIIWQSEHLRLERIISCGHISPPDFWYEQEEDEWVMVISGEGAITWDNGEISHLKAGESLLIPRKKKHRVSYTSINPPCIWLALFAPHKEG